ncbi:hypothetical protein L596_017070 [Steinernema carpocapsae]|uniref:Uncharacterized protein n=1 Tax=Steinernema carpocapsae TaxID=34508 RepID=A0A4U5N191_STECR|nr:hypothetical protein L596_017070 [Steinernema carpocapsae]
MHLPERSLTLQDIALQNLFTRLCLALDQKEAWIAIEDLLLELPLPTISKKQIRKVERSYGSFCKKFIVLLSDVPCHVGIIVKKGEIDTEATILSLRDKSIISPLMAWFMFMAMGMDKEFQEASNPLPEWTAMDQNNHERLQELFCIVMGIVRFFKLREFDLPINGEDLDYALIDLKAGVITCLDHKWQEGAVWLLRSLRDKKELFEPHMYQETFVFLFNRALTRCEANELLPFINEICPEIDTPTFREAFCNENQAGRLQLSKFTNILILSSKVKEVENLMVALKRFLPRHDFEMLRYRVERDGKEPERSLVVGELARLSLIAAQ